MADRWIQDIAALPGGDALGGLEGATLLGERAVLGGFRIPGCVSAGGGCRLYAARHGRVALNLARDVDRELLPALLETTAPPVDEAALARLIAVRDADELVARGRLLGLAIAGEAECSTSPASERMSGAAPPGAERHRPPRVLDLSSLWAGPLAAHLLWLLGAEVTKVESRRRPDAMRDGDPAFYHLLNQGKASVALDLAAADGRGALLALIARADIVIEAARPRALLQLGIDADVILRARPDLIWLTLTGHGAVGEAAMAVGFGDDAGVAGGLSSALFAATGRPGFLGDAIADPLTGLFATHVAWDAWTQGDGGRFGIAMRGVAAAALAEARAADPRRLDDSLRCWRAAEGQPFPAVRRRPACSMRPLGADTQAALAEAVPC